MMDDMRQKALERLAQIDTSDIEIAHLEADAILCAALVALDYEDVVAAYHKIKKWYA